MQKEQSGYRLKNGGWGRFSSDQSKLQAVRLLQKRKFALSRSSKGGNFPGLCRHFPTSSAHFPS